MLNTLAGTLSDLLPAIVHPRSASAGENKGDVTVVQ